MLLFLATIQFSYRIRETIKTHFALGHLGAFFVGTLRDKDAEAIIEKLQRLQDKSFVHEKTSEYLDNARNLAKLYKREGRSTEAKTLLKTALKTIKGVQYPDTHNSVLRLEAVLGLVHRDEGEYLEAERIFNNIINKTTTAHGINHSTVSKNLFELAELYRLKRNFDDAFFHYSLASSIRKKISGSKHVDLADIYHG